MSLSVAGQPHRVIRVGCGSRRNDSKLVKFGNGELMGRKIIPAHVGKNASAKHLVRMSLTADFADSKVSCLICYTRS